jgi:hypothetical protein
MFFFVIWSAFGGVLGGYAIIRVLKNFQSHLFIWLIGLSVFTPLSLLFSLWIFAALLGNPIQIGEWQSLVLIFGFILGFPVAFWSLVNTINTSPDTVST